MSAMTPTIAQVIDSVITSIDQHVRPDVTDPYARSVLLTIDNLLRHVAIRAEHEAEMRSEDNEDLADVLGRMVTLLAGDAGILEHLETQIRATRTELEVREQGFPAPRRLSLRSMRLRARLDELLAALIAGRDRFGQRPACGEARALAHAYLARTLTRDGALIDPAFVSDRR
jgi:hypothetical protein